MFCPLVQNNCIKEECVFFKRNLQNPESGECKFTIMIDDIDTIKNSLNVMELEVINKNTLTPSDWDK